LVPTSRAGAGGAMVARAEGQMVDFDELNRDEAMRRGLASLAESETLYAEINAAEGRSNIDIEKHLRRSEVRAAHAQVWLALARELGSQGERY
jgi:hypothetical protein